MSVRSTWLWLAVAASLFAFIFFYQRHTHSPPPAPARIFPNLKAAEVTSIQIRPGGPARLQIRADRTNGTWQLTEPLSYPAQALSIEKLLSVLELLTPAAYISEAEIRHLPRADTEFGFKTPQASIILQQGEDSPIIRIGSRTAPGDQVFVQVVGLLGAYLVDSDLLNYIPRSDKDWRDTTVIELDRLALDRIAVTNNSKAFVLQRELTNRLWRLVWPFTTGARADNSRIEECLRLLHGLRVRQFISDESNPDLESFGLAPAELELAFGKDTNALAWLQFGKTATNDPGQVYARRVGQNTIFTVAKDLQTPWRAPLLSFRDPHLLTLTQPVQSIIVKGQDTFSLENRTNETWHLLPEDLPADTDLVKELLATLTTLPIVEFVKDVVNAPDWPQYGLASPIRRYTLKASAGDGSGPATNSVIAELNFGLTTNQPGKVFARRSDESYVYAVSTNEFARLPSVSWQMRDRKLWHFAEDDIVQVTIRNQGKTRQILRKGPHQWSLAPGSQGMINDLAVEDTVGALSRVSAVVWVARGEVDRARYGFSDKPYEITIELRKGDKAKVEFGGESPSGNPYAAVKLDGQEWIFEFPASLYSYLLLYLAVPANL